MDQAGWFFAFAHGCFNVSVVNILKLPRRIITKVVFFCCCCCLFYLFFFFAHIRTAHIARLIENRQITTREVKQQRLLTKPSLGRFQCHLKSKKTTQVNKRRSSRGKLMKTNNAISELVFSGSQLLYSPSAAS